MTGSFFFPELGPATSLIQTIVVANWGREVSCECLYDPLGVARPYRLVFRGCRTLRWSVIAFEEDTSDEPADVIDFVPGQPHYQQEALITTDQFELAILYDKVELHRSE